MTIRAVVDPGVLVSALLVPDTPPARVLDAWRRGQFDLVVSQRLLDELEVVLERPKLASRITAEERSDVLATLREEAEVHDDPQEAERLTEDPDDDYLAALAIAANATYLVTGDRALGRWRSSSVEVLTPREFLDEVLA